jgi:hypothetical protein
MTTWKSNAALQTHVINGMSKIGLCMDFSEKFGVNFITSNFSSYQQDKCMERKVENFS